jgi:valyl-tRNA synthetase
VSKLHLLIESVTASYDKFFFGEVGREIYDFFWADFADWYVNFIIFDSKYMPQLDCCF